MSIFNYNKRNFNELREEYINYIKLNYPDVFTNFEDNAVGSIFIDLLAGLGENLYFNLDRTFQETQISNAQLRKSLLEIAKNKGVKIPNKKPSITLIDIEAIVPAQNDTFNVSYLPIIKQGTLFTNGNTNFELLYDVDFNNEFSNNGIPNRTIIPILNNFNEVISYRITKREIIVNGSTKIIRIFISEADVKLFFEIILPDNDIIDIETVIAKTGNVTTLPDFNDFSNPDLLYYQVDSLAETEVFVETTPVYYENGIKRGYWKKINKKFIKEFTENNFCKITFGGGSNNITNFNSIINNTAEFSILENYLLNNALGEQVKPNTTIFIKYRTGGGLNTNVGPNSITTILNKNVVVNGINNNINLSVINSIKCNNPIPALGGRDTLSNDEIRYLTMFNFAAQNRAITLPDYNSILLKMNGKFGVPFKYITNKVNNKIVYSILGLDNEGKLNNTSTDLLKENIAEFLSSYRAVNDYIEIEDGQIFNLKYNIDVLVERTTNNDLEIATQIIKVVSDFHSIFTNRMGEDIYIGRLIENINNVPFVININKIRCFNKVSGLYSDNISANNFINNDANEREIDLSDGLIYNTPNGMFEIKYPNIDIQVTVSKLG
jgi:hypothetical protein